MRQSNNANHVRVSVYLNGSGPGAPGRRVLLDRTESLESNMERIALKLGLQNRCPQPIVYTIQGITVTDMEEIIEGEVLYFEPRGKAYDQMIKRETTPPPSSSPRKQPATETIGIEPALHRGNSFEYEYLFKFIIVGDVAVGKSCLLLRFVDQRFRPNYEATIGVDFGTRTVPLRGNHNIKLQVWDTAGQENFIAITRAYFREAAAALLVFDVCNRQSFENLGLWMENVRNGCSNNTITIALVANKSDLVSRVVSTTEGETFARNNGLLYFETSALSGNGIHEAFTRTAEAVFRKVDSGIIDVDEPRHGVRRGESKSAVSLMHNHPPATNHETSGGCAC